MELLLPYIIPLLFAVVIFLLAISLIPSKSVLTEQLEALAAGRDPIGLCFDANAGPVEFEAGNFIREA